MVMWGVRGRDGFRNNQSVEVEMMLMKKYWSIINFWTYEILFSSQKIYKIYKFLKNFPANKNKKYVFNFVRTVENRKQSLICFGNRRSFAAMGKDKSFAVEISFYQIIVNFQHYSLNIYRQKFYVGKENGKHCTRTVSYTHLDVYKRQV